MKDTRIRYTRAEREAVEAHRVRRFCLANQNVAGDEMAARFLSNLDAIERACQEPGPFIYAVHQTRIEKLILGNR
jgi:hypothetical protein